ncbi:uncharacterized protein LOC130998282 [Salvia miltiorrhiza]|uniref:uncharacterized protein LOC130998282 n=1 Tax=Salvia miltiorrhiza TaxID=226208 RepID=UPI0025AB6CC0|nr:uncharacterized protein LOC130998282 [Salvia miltiorrhiza]
MERGGPSSDSDLVNGPEERTDREATLIDISSDFDNQSDKGICLVGSLISMKAPNGFHLMEIMRKSWKTEQNFEAREWRKNLFLFTFESAADREWVLQRQPWHFDNHLFAIKGLDDTAQPSTIRVDRGSFWIRAYNLPIKCMTPAIIRNIGKQIGIVEEVDEKTNYTGCFARFKVNLDITVPLLRGITIFFEARQLWIPLKYESLPIYCYKCGIMNHHTRACEKETEAEESGKHFDDIEYGPILKASPLKRLRTKKQHQPMAPKPNPLRDLQSHASTHPPVPSAKPQPPPLAYNPPPHTTAHALTNTQPISHQTHSTPNAIHTPSEENSIPILKKQINNLQTKPLPQASTTSSPIITPKTEPETKKVPSNTAPFNPNKDITPITDLAKLLNLKLPDHSTKKPQPKKEKTWTRFNRSPTPKTPKVHHLTANHKKRHFMEEENVVLGPRKDEVEAMQKRLKGTKLDDDSSSTTALSAEIAMEQSRRAQ